MIKSTTAHNSAAFGIAGLLAVLALSSGITAHTVSSGLALTGRWSFVLFWLAYVGLGIGADGRKFGLAFASAHVVHISLVILLYQIADDPPPRWILIFFGIAVGWTYFLAALSFPTISKAVGWTVSRVSRILGMNYILMVFAYDFFHGLNNARDLRHFAIFFPLSLLVFAAPILRLRHNERRTVVLQRNR